MSVSSECILKDYSKDSLFDHVGLDTLRDRYMLPSEQSPQDALARACAAFADDAEHAQRLYNYASQHWFMFATPLLSNGGTPRGLPISCFLNYVADSRESIFNHWTENGWLSSAGGGIGTYWGALRSANEKTSKGSASSGVIPFVKVVDSEMLAVSQGVTRRGSGAVYLDVSHPEIAEWIGMRKKSGGDLNRKTLNLHNGVCIPDAFMEAVEKGTQWLLIDPHSKEVKQTVEARTLWRQILTTRVETGEPYLFFSDTANRGLPQPLKDKGFRIHASNLCTEIMLPTNEDRTAVCCLSSVNLAKWGEWCDDPQFIEDLMRMLDNALQSYIDTAPESHWRAAASAGAERSVGLGAMGFHTFLQMNDIAFDSPEASGVNLMVFQQLEEQTTQASLKLGAERGEAPDMVGTGHRFAHRMAIAPNATSSIICGNVSPSIEPMRANAYLQKTMGGTFMVKNKVLESVLAERGKNTPAVWKTIASHEGSVQHLDFLTDHEKWVFRTAMEIEQMSIIDLAADRQHYIDQGQSVNLFVPPDVTGKELHALHFGAWKNGLKALYYLRSTTLKRADLAKLSTERATIVAPQEDDCKACEG
jgi:ribonucleoside-diphosphate reductase alpha chain